MPWRASESLCSEWDDVMENTLKSVLNKMMSQRASENLCSEWDEVTESIHLQVCVLNGMMSWRTPSSLFWMRWCHREHLKICALSKMMSVVKHYIPSRTCGRGGCSPCDEEVVKVRKDQGGDAQFKGSQDLSYSLPISHQLQLSTISSVAAQHVASGQQHQCPLVWLDMQRLTTTANLLNLSLHVINNSKGVCIQKHWETLINRIPITQ